MDKAGGGAVDCPYPRLLQSSRVREEQQHMEYECVIKVCYGLCVSVGEVCSSSLIA